MERLGRSMIDIWRGMLDGLRRIGLTMPNIRRSINEGEKEKAGGRGPCLLVCCNLNGFGFSFWDFNPYHAILVGGFDFAVMFHVGRKSH
jgi:hypothetical protein